MYEKLEICPSCKHPQFENYIICEDHSVSRESFALVKCTKCGLIFTNPRPDPDSLPKYYQSEDYISHTDKANSLVNFLYKIVRSYALKKKRKLIETYNESGTVLDFGCGTGDFLKSCEKNKWEVTGVEPNEGARKIAQLKITGDITSTLDPLVKKKQFDIITAWHVIEHVSDLRKTLKTLRKLLKPNGHLLVAVPNANSYDASYYKESWAAYDVPRHLYHFTSESFTRLCKGIKLNLIEILPMKFDAYYVSLLSEKYKHDKSRLLKSFSSGWKSNSKASKSGEYSSLIFVLKNKS